MNIRQSLALGAAVAGILAGSTLAHAAPGSAAGHERTEMNGCSGKEGEKGSCGGKEGGKGSCSAKEGGKGSCSAKEGGKGSCSAKDKEAGKEKGKCSGPNGCGSKDK